METLPSRPIRGGELCPFNQYSVALFQLLQYLHSDVKTKLFPVCNNAYPIVLGTSSYLNRLSMVNLNNTHWANCWVISGDFSNAYTLGTLSDLNESVNHLCGLVGWASHCISLVLKLCE